MGTLAHLRKLQCTSISTPLGVIQIDQVEAKVPTILHDVKGSRDKKKTALQQLKTYYVFLNTDQKKSLILNLVEVIKNETAELKGLAASILELLIDNENEGRLIKESKIIPSLISMCAVHSKEPRQFAFRVLYKLSSFTHNHLHLATHSVLRHAISEIQKDHSQICSDTCVQLIAAFAKDSLYASQIVSNHVDLNAIINLLRTPQTTPLKYITPAITAVRRLARHDSVSLREVINAGAVPLLIGITVIPQSQWHPRMQVNAALAMCEFACTKDIETQDLLTRAGIGDVIAGCLRHNSSEVRRAAILALERWLYSDDRLTLLAIEFFLTLIQNGVEVSPQVKTMLMSLKSLTKPKPEVPAIAALLAEIKQRPESTNAELARLRSENQALLSEVKAQEVHAKNLQDVLARCPALESTQGTHGTQGQLDITSIRSFEELSKLEERISKQRANLVTEMQDRLVCSVCMDKQKDSTLSPCGHTLCSTCAQKILAVGKCHECRLKVDRIGKLFL